MAHVGLRNPYKIGVTGGIGSGKSVVSRLLRLMGVPVYDCDSEAKRLMCSKNAVRDALIAAVGSEVYCADGTLNRAFLSAYMFGYPERVAQVNGIVHPAVRADFDEWARCSGQAVVAVESAILFEAGMDADVDAVWLVCAPESLRLQRAMLRDGASEAAIKRRMQSQMNDEHIAQRASFIVRNDGHSSLINQVTSLLQGLRK